MGAKEPLRRGTLSRDRIVGAALDLVDADGLEALTMRRLATSLGCEPMSLYKHVPDKETLLDLIVELVLSDFRAPASRLGWRRQATFVADELRRLALAHPHAFALVAVRLPASPVALAPVEAALAALTAAGLPDAEVVSAFWALVAYTTGALIAETAAITGTVQTFPFAPELVGAVAAPQVSRLAAALAGCDWEAEYHAGLSLLIRSIDADRRGATI